ncbi:serine hydroxymethyltransferase [Mycoplasma miroungirhinis]|uniref:Serine hydroxymethyltransferase n=1 Tax=Mycoplasma miroungirhinis TaxID=754516 RepID=A0A6M4JD12_9MOLU|nr:serine hydroxymethyltransferase [Mycoplasma miroungirhinis]QJR43926.1 serine hydroxymethyltransferase [Mycoplasma miroungirhinis]
MYKKVDLRDKEIAELINKEAQRQNENIELIASENYVSEDVMKAAGSCLTNKYAEGYPNARYYDGCEYADEIEKIAISRACQLFSCAYANVQPYSGSVANAAVYMSLCEPNDRVLGLQLSSGGHLTHGYKISFSGKFYDSHFYEVDENGILDYDKIEQIALEVKPKMIITGYSAYSQIIDFKRFREIANKVGAYLFADISHIAGLVVAGEHPSPFPYADVVMTTTHKTLRGTRGAIILTNSEEIIKKINRSVFPGYQGGPLVHQIAAKAVSFNEALTHDFKKYAQQIILNANVFCRQFISKGVKVISGLTQNHLFIIDVKTSYGLTGKKAADILSIIKITANKNSIPQDQEKPTVTSGIRLGVAAMTTRGFTENQFIILANLIHKALSEPENFVLHEIIKKEILKLSADFPIKKYTVNE